MRLCDHCGAELSGEASECPECGWVSENELKSGGHIQRISKAREAGGDSGDFTAPENRATCGTGCVSALVLGGGLLVIFLMNFDPTGK